MARTALQKTYADFRQGFVTVANPLAYPEGSLKDIVNFDIQDNGTIKVRPGLRLESNFTVDTGNTINELNNSAITAGVWTNVRNAGDEEIAVVQVGQKIYLFDMKSEGIDLENPLKVFDDTETGITTAQKNKQISFTSGSGLLFVSHPSTKPFFIKRTGLTTFKIEAIDIKIRDLSLWEGSPDIEDLNPTATVDTQTGLLKGPTLYPQHEYNLRNGGWPTSTTVLQGTDPDDSIFENRDPVEYTKLKRGYYPLVSYPFSAGRSGGGSTTVRQVAYTPWAFDTVYFGTTTAPVGRFIVNAEEWTRSGNGSTALDPSIPTSDNLEKTYKWTQYPSAVEFYSGRLWYTGAKGYQEDVTPATFLENIKDDNLDVSNVLYFSQQIESDLGRVGKCYQENDPTADDINQLLATDGGTLAIRGVGEILDIKTFGTSLIVFSKEGVWAVSGVDTNSFKADSVSVTKISNIGPASKNTITATNKTLYYIANDAIYVLVADQVSGQPTPQDITSEKIKGFYTELSSNQKKNAKAVFDPANKLFYMFYSDIDDPQEEDFDLIFNKALVFNQDLGAFYKYDINLNGNYILDGLFYDKDNFVVIEESIVVDSVQVVVDGENVAKIREYSTESLSNVQLLTIIDNGNTGEIAFSSFTDIDTLQDYGTDYTGYVEFGFDIAGDIMRDSVKTPVIISHMERTEDGYIINPDDPDEQELLLDHASSCLLSYGWDWATSYKNQFQLYRFNRNYVPSGAEDPFNYGVDVITTRNRIRGKGYSLGIRLDSEAGKDCRVLGLGILYTQAQRV